MITNIKATEYVYKLEHLEMCEEPINIHGPK